jgi:hypothetical protein
MLLKLEWFYKHVWVLNDFSILLYRSKGASNCMFFIVPGLYYIFTLEEIYVFVDELIFIN